LTGAYNTRFFHEVLGRETARSQRYNTALSLLMIDADTFKVINDTHGHVMGDKVLVHIGRELTNSVRNTDLVFRCGGDEFGVVLPATKAEGALSVGEKILERIRAVEGFRSQGISTSTTVSIGAAEYEHGENWETLVSHADQALYDAKNAGRNTIRLYKKDKRVTPP
jgi:diguanylate cyclase (GGDEF)-like protein